MNRFLDFIKNTPTAFHAVEELKAILFKNGYVELKETEKWDLANGGKFFLTRNSSSLVAFTVPANDYKSYQITAAHLDSPTFKLKPNFTLDKGKYIKLNTEVYGGPIYSTWFDRPLGIAGRVFVLEDGNIVEKLININEPLTMIPNLPIHYNRKANSGMEYNPQIDLIPLYADKNFGSEDLTVLISKKLGVAKENILSSDLYLTVLDRGSLVGPNKEFVMAPQIDNLECSLALTLALIDSSNDSNVNICALFDNEEVGSSTRQGACGTLLLDTLKRIAICKGVSEEEHLTKLAASFIISADNAQGFHPNYPGKYDETNPCFLNEGIVIKNAARGSYSTDALSSAYFQKVCKDANVKYQLNTNRSDVLGGSTLGALSLRHVSIPSVDIGLAQLAMHSAMETAGSKDFDSLIQVITKFYNITK